MRERRILGKKLNGALLYAYVQRLRNRVRTLLLSGSLYSFGERSTFAGSVRLVNPETIEIGRGSFIGPGCWLQGRVVNLEEHLAPSIRIGDHVSVTGWCNISAEYSVRIGDRVLIARGVHISDHEHSTKEDRPIMDQGSTPPEPIEISDGVWIGQGSIVRPGVKIGRNSVIGANSIVASNIPDGVIAVGVPARVIRTLGGRLEIEDGR